MKASEGGLKANDGVVPFGLLMRSGSGKGRNGGEDVGRELKAKGNNGPCPAAGFPEPDMVFTGTTMCPSFIYPCSFLWIRALGKRGSDGLHSFSKPGGPNAIKSILCQS